MQASVTLDPVTRQLDEPCEVHVSLPFRTSFERSAESVGSLVHEGDVPRRTAGDDHVLGSRQPGDGTTVFPPPRRGRPHGARAYCGEAHQHWWTVPDWPPPDVVELAIPSGTRSYRMVRHPRTGAPARDAHGDLVFIPVRDSDITW